MGYKYDSLFFEDVHLGQDLPTLRMPITVQKLVMAASASRDWQPQHHDRDYCQQHANKKDMFLGVWFYTAMITRFLTDWAGPEAFVSRVGYRIKESIFPGDEMRVEGRVTGLRSEGDRHFVEVDVLVSSQEGPVAPATAVVILPSVSHNS